MPVNKTTASTEATKPNQPGLSAEKSITTNNTTVMENTMFPDEQIAAQPKPAKPTAKQRKLDLEEYRTTFLSPVTIGKKRKQITVVEETWLMLERISRILGDHTTTVSSYVESILRDHLKRYGEDIETWRKL